MSKTCYYELLGLNYADRASMDADVIKKAYRKIALKMHPDKAHVNNLSVDAATSRFQEIQEAYETLSDAQERAWYDQHREQILGGVDLGEGGDSFTDDLDLYQYFKSFPFDDTPKGFFTVFRELFEKIGAEEMQWQENPRSPPIFGSSSSPWTVTGAFYSHWLNFCSKRPCGHADKWRSQDGHNRQIRRAMEAENKQARNAARKEYNADIRALVQRMHRRDPRVKAKKEADEEKKSAKKALEEAQREEAKRLRKIEREEAQLREQERWAQIDAERKANGEDVADSEDEEQIVYFCEACQKTFKSDKAMDSHTQSKKHKKLWEEFLSQQLEEEKEEEEEEKGVTSPSSAGSPWSPAKKSFVSAVSKDSARRKSSQDDSSPSSSSSSDASFGAFARRMKKQPPRTVVESEDDESEGEKNENGGLNWGTSKQADDKNEARGNADRSTEDNDRRRGEDTADADTNGRRGDKAREADIDKGRGADTDTHGARAKNEAVSQGNAATEESDGEAKDVEQDLDVDTTDRKKKRRRNKAKDKAVSSSASAPAGAPVGKKCAARKDSMDEEALHLACGKCGEAFASRNGLFTHLKRFPAHALLKDVPVDTKKGKKKGKR